MSPTAEVLRALPTRVAEKYNAAVKAGAVFYYDSEVHVSDVDKEPGSTPARSVAWHIRNVPALMKKHRESPLPPAAPQQNPRDVFAPPYVPNLFVEELGDYTILLNKFCVLPRHHLIVTKDFVKQELPPSPEMLLLVYRIIRTHTPTAPGAEMLGFFNCGPQSGASQPHCHFQLVELDPVGDGSAVPIESLLSRIERDGKEYDADKWEAYLGTRMTQALDAMFQTLAQSGLPAGRPSFNVLLTKRALHIIPRRADEFDLRRTDWGKFSTGKAEDGVGTISVNSLGYAGLLLTKDLDEQAALKDDDNAHIIEILEYAGVPRGQQQAAGGGGAEHDGE
ncbi:ATP adenylyltransferase [Malassezia sp. CBS 17886]|nr:ATP adenylyltransferase [Malassezia sp. CBS 17886]